MSDVKTIVAEAFKEAQPAQPSVKEGNPGAAGVLDNIPSMKVFGLSVGDAVKGMAVAGVGDVLGRLILARLPLRPPAAGAINFNAAIANGAAAFVLQLRPVKRFLGEGAANLGSLLLVIDAVSNVVQVRSSVANMVGRFTGSFMPGSGYVWGGGQPGTPPQPLRPGNVVAQAGQVVDAYSGKAFGGA